MSEDEVNIGDIIPDVVAFITARMDNNEDGAVMVLDQGNPSRILLGVTDLTIAMIMFISDMLGINPREFVKTMGMLGGILATRESK